MNYKLNKNYSLIVDELVVVVPVLPGIDHLSRLLGVVQHSFHRGKNMKIIALGTMLLSLFVQSAYAEKIDKRGDAGAYQAFEESKKASALWKTECPKVREQLAEIFSIRNLGTNLTGPASIDCNAPVTFRDKDSVDLVMANLIETAEMTGDFLTRIFSGEDVYNICREAKWSEHTIAFAKKHRAKNLPDQLKGVRFVTNGSGHASYDPKRQILSIAVSSTIAPEVAQLDVILNALFGPEPAQPVDTAMSKFGNR